ncbi:MAG TPA: HEXXH motif-containing putative peptide modification protein [Streptosporangiaceae bacterium]|nr:HEXXH motif-containing putative peptide modification protein [Streptosporangiaceae bacterium]
MANSYVIPGTLFAALSRGHGGEAAGRWLAAAERTKHLLLLRGVVEAARAAAHPCADEFTQAYWTLADIQRQSAGAVEAVVMQPAVAAWAAEAIQQLSSGIAADLPARRMSGVVAAAAVRAGIPYRSIVAADDAWVMIPSLGRACLPSARVSGRAEIEVTRAGVEISAGGDRIRLPQDPCQDGPGWQAIRRISAHAGGRTLRLMVDDIDPYRFAAFPGVGGRLTGGELLALAARLNEAIGMLVTHHQRVAGEVFAMVTVLTPLAIAAPSQAQAHATSRDTFGCVAMSLPRDGRSLALALTHEVQHAKLAALLDLVALVRPTATSARYYAPWRDDPRPIAALLHGTYAFLGVAGYWQRQRQHETGELALSAHAEFARWHSATAGAVRDLATSGSLTGLGRRFLAGMEATVQLRGRASVPSEAARLARTAAMMHREQWRRLHEA